MNRTRSWKEVAVPVAAKHFRRLAMLGFLVVLALIGVVVRLTELQYQQGAVLRSLAERQRQRMVHHAPLRGRIVDCNGVTLAQSALVKTVTADPSQVGERYAPLVAACLAGPLEMTVDQLTELLRRNVRTNGQGQVEASRYVLLKRFVTPSRWAAARVALNQLDFQESDRGCTESERRLRQRRKRQLIQAIQTEPVEEQIRHYPAGGLAAHVLGFVAYKLSPEAGAEGIEGSFNSILRGVAGWEEREMVKRGNKVFFEAAETLSARPGLNIRLTLDAVLQGIVERQLDEGMDQLRPVSISCVVVRPRTGEILALANRPTFDPNRYGESSPEQRRNRAIADAHEPGSTFKVITIGGALEAGAVGLGDRIDCERGQFRWRGVSLGDVHPNDILTVEGVLAKSSNIGAAKVGLILGEERLHEAVRRFGIGQPTGIPLPGEGRGMLHPTSRWSKISAAWIPMGHEVAATPIQMTMAVAAVANAGRLMRPMLVRSVEDDAGNVVARVAPQMRGQAISARTARDLTQGLERAVEEGTGRRARMEGYRLAGKTGTAQKIVDQAYVHDRHYASFIGFFPADDPQLCIGVFVDDPRRGSYGGETAAPIFREVAMQSAAYLGIPPTSVGGELTRNLARREATDPMNGAQEAPRM